MMSRTAPYEFQLIEQPGFRKGYRTVDHIHTVGQLILLYKEYVQDIKGFPFSLENIPKQTSFASLSLKFGSIISAIILILYSIFGLASCLAALNGLPPHWSPEDTDVIFSYAVIIVVAIIHAITLFMSTLMMIGVLKEKIKLIKPWVILTTLQLLVDVMVFVFWTTLGMIHHYGDTTDLVIYVLEFLGLMVRFYMLTIVSSYYRQLEEITLGEREKLRDLINNENWYTA